MQYRSGLEADAGRCWLSGRDERSEERSDGQLELSGRDERSEERSDGSTPRGGAEPS